jgi:hypothetical protein
LGVGGDAVVDLQRECECGAAVVAGDAGRGAGADGVEEVFKFEAQRLAVGDLDLLQGETGGGVSRRSLRG